MDPLTPLTLSYDGVTLPIMCKCMYRKSSRKIALVDTALNDLQINLTCSNCQNSDDVLCSHSDHEATGHVIAFAQSLIDVFPGNAHCRH